MTPEVNMPAIDRSHLEQYARVCQTLQEDLSIVLEEIDFRKRGGSVRYAADFSEIYSYILPGASAGTPFFEDQEEEKSQAIEINALSKLFFGGEKIILVAPYIVELHGFTRTLRQGSVEELVRELPTALSDARNLLKMEETHRVLELADRVLKDGEKLNAEQVKEVFSFFSEHAAHMVLLLSSPNRTAIKKLRTFLGEERLEPLSNLVGVEVSGTEHGVHDNFSRLQELRPTIAPGSNYLDAVALEILQKANLVLSQQNCRLCLISRSTSLRHLLQQDSQREWRLSSRWYLRHPRTFTSFFDPPGFSFKETVDLLSDRSRKLSLFIQSARETLADKTWPRDATQALTLSDMMEPLKAEWRETGSLASMDVNVDSIAKPSDRDEREHTIVTLFRLLLSSSELISEISRHIADAAREIDQEHTFLGWYLQSSSDEARHVIEERFIVEGWDDKAVFISTVDSMHYTLQFFSEDVRKRVEQLQEGGNIYYDQVIDFFRSKFPPEDAYERLLAMAFTLGLLGKWLLGEKYCEAALVEANVTGFRAVHEGYFFLALCKRKGPRSAKKIRAALRLLDQATELKKQRELNDDYEDPRYIKEKATQLQVLRSILREKNTQEPEALWKGKVEEIADLLRKGLLLARDDVRLRAQIYNGLTYLYLTERWPHFKEEALKNLELLEEALDSFQPDPLNWPANVLDTVAWGRFKLFGDEANKISLELWVSFLEEAASRPLVPKEDQQRVRRHLSLVKRKILCSQVESTGK